LKVDGVFAEAAGVCQEDAGFAFSNELPVVLEVAITSTGCMEAAELEFDVV
jgi:hypothetical protein